MITTIAMGTVQIHFNFYSVSLKDFLDLKEGISILQTKAMQVALIVFFAHIGSFVPADAAKVGLTDRHVTSRSLCLLDEFGKGTLTEDGIGLHGGTIDHFISMYSPPKVLICTHLTQIFTDSDLCEIFFIFRFYQESLPISMKHPFSRHTKTRIG
ncbi:DNA mismatch repair protein MSH5 isoform X2 [Lactuca sativa]|uniref:DNA mismatch repair protein MSH5 isoform X2 n=1 Tax=Lactuca sativa TaxID=4236 RepID=UPI001C68B35A|nr:DNA mismatch repair protein MSH5 isoform X2 [Lactuca sativa]